MPCEAHIRIKAFRHFRLDLLLRLITPSIMHSWVYMRMRQNLGIGPADSILPSSLPWITCTERFGLNGTVSWTRPGTSDVFAWHWAENVATHTNLHDSKDKVGCRKHSSSRIRNMRQYQGPRASFNVIMQRWSQNNSFMRCLSQGLSIRGASSTIST